MKRSKIFLGITTGVLAVVAFTAAKTAKFTTKFAGYYTSTSVPANCTLSGGVASAYTFISGAATYVVGGHKLYKKTTGACSVKLYTFHNRGSQD